MCLYVQACGQFTQAARQFNRTVYSSVVPIAAILPFNVTSATDTTSARVVMVTVNMRACPRTKMRVFVKAYRHSRSSSLFGKILLKNNFNASMNVS